MRRTADLFDLTGKVAIVTGSTKGIGRAMVEGLARAGASVVVSSRKQELCDQVAAEVAAATGADVLRARLSRRRLGRDPRVRRRGARALRPHRRAGEQRRDQPGSHRAGRHDARVLAQGVLGEPRGAAAGEPVRVPASCATRAAAASCNIGTMAAYSGGAQHLRLRRVEGRAAQPHQEHGAWTGRRGTCA